MLFQAVETWQPSSLRSPDALIPSHIPAASFLFLQNNVAPFLHVLQFSIHYGHTNV